MRRRELILLVLLFGIVPSCSQFDTGSSLKKWLLNFRLETVPPDPSDGAFTLSRFGITWYFNRPLAAGTEYGQYANGDYWVAGPVSIIYIDPISWQSRTKRVLNGSMIIRRRKAGPCRDMTARPTAGTGPITIPR